MDPAYSIQDQISFATDCIQVLLTNMRTVSLVSSEDALPSLHSFDRLLLETSAFVRSYTNSITPVNRLPAEVLSDIFSLASLTPFHPGYPLRPEGRYQSSRILQTQIMRVCRQWRDVAQSTTPLWSDIILLPYRGIPLSSQIRWAGTTSINVYSEGHVNPLVPILAEHAHRIRRLHIRTIDSFWIDMDRRIHAVFAILPRLALHIEELVLHAWKIHWCPPTASVFSGCAPRLRVLSLFQLAFVPTDHFPALRELYIVLQNAVEQSQLLDMLRGSPMLELIHIAAPRVELPPNGAPSSRVPSLPHLRAIVLCFSRNTHCLLSDLVLPPKGCLVRLQEIALHEVSYCLEALEGRLDAGQLTKLSWNKGSGMGYISSREVLYVTLCNAAADSGLTFGISLHGQPASAFKAVFSQAFSACPLYAHVTELSVFDKRDLVKSELLDSLRSLTTINHIFAAPKPRKLCGRARRKRREAPRVPVLAQAASGGAVVCPTLHTLYLIGCDAAELTNACDILRFRKEAGRPLTRLGIDCSAHFREDVDALRDLVDELDVAVTDELGYEAMKWGNGEPKGEWRSHSARARYQWPQWQEFREV
ncbi:hypothetical protein VTO73DRAFT_5406 [Trametes versicolor]